MSCIRNGHGKHQFHTQRPAGNDWTKKKAMNFKRRHHNLGQVLVEGTRKHIAMP